MVVALVRIWRSEEDYEDREVKVNHLDLALEVAVLGFRFRNHGAEPKHAAPIGLT